MALGKGNRKHGVHSHKTRNRIFRIYLIQAVLCMVLSSALLLHDLVTAWSALLGGGLYLLPNLYFAHRALTFREKQSAKIALAEMYLSQIWKMGISILAFAAVFILVHPLNPFSLFGTFILMQITSWLAQMKLNNRFLKL
ncbi:ATP synthase subunit I [uncultured Neptuniibacter sp.]|uniref:ATP synthase subunit I n=1 Tax=uncultured Neptuniibacter sp. TaxID=502143 RepID=UPI002604DC5C|nr:ATP synthase subunit I [uncultured Neptuniibacter sp.]